jgi:two-component system, chemotaxis family, sensor kinase CheA
LFNIDDLAKSQTGDTMAGNYDNPSAEILHEFVAESRATLERVEPMVLGLDYGTDANSDVLAALFRCFHSFKGTAAFCGLHHTARLAAAAEGLLELHRRGCPIERRHTDLMCNALDTFRATLTTIEAESSDEARARECSELSAAINQTVGASQTLGSPRGSGLASMPAHQARTSTKPALRLSSRAAPAQSSDANDDLDFFIESTRSSTVVTLPEEFLFKFVAESEEHLAKVEEVLVALESGGASDEQLADAFRAMHSFKGNCGICGYGDMEKLTHRAETLMGEFREKKRVPDEHCTSVLLECLDVLRGALATIPGGDGRLATLSVLLDRMNNVEAWREAPEATRDTPSSSREASKVSKREVQRGSGSIRVDTDKLDDLMNLVGELIIAETTVTRNPDLEGHEFENFQKAALNLNRLTRALQDIAMAVRMVPIATTFRKMSRLVRDVSTKQKKRVELLLSGEDTEVDKTVIESIADPLIHLIRNSIDHGIEGPEERVRSSKDATGRVWLDAKHQGGEVWITIRDDGRGLDPERIMKKAVERGLADPNRRYTDREIFEFIFLPGFSTAAQITEISGRGVGMDVVRRNIEAVNGRVDVSSELNRGTMFTLRIPLTLAIIEGMLVRVGKSFYTIPLLSIRESVKAQPADITYLSDGGELLKLRRRHYPIVKLSERYAVGDGVESALDGILVIVESGERLACVLVDEVVGQRQTVIKPLPEHVKRVRGLAGCSILHNGDISLILDVEGVVGSEDSRAA